MDVKKRTRNIQQKLKEFGHNVKLTHCREVLAIAHGLRNSHQLEKDHSLSKVFDFLLPSERWLMGPLKKITQEMIFSRESFSSRFFSEEELGSLFEQSTSLLKIEKASLLWRLLIFEFWYKINFEKVV